MMQLRLIKKILSTATAVFVLSVFLAGVQADVQAVTIPPGTLPAPTKDTCDQTTQPSKCKNDYDKCGPGSSAAVKKCRQKILNNYLLNSLPSLPPPISACNKVSDSDGCKQAYRACAHINDGRTPNDCRRQVIQSWQIAGIIPLPPPKKETCNHTTQPSKCKDEYKACGGGSSDKVKKCRRKVINKYLTNSLTPIGSAPGGGTLTTGKRYQCGNLSSDNRNVQTKFNFGCLGKDGPSGLSPILDLVYALIRFASVGVGIAIVLSMILAGVQYSAAEGSPESTQKAKLRIQNAVIGLAIYIFAFSALQYIIPGGIFKP